MRTLSLLHTLLLEAAPLVNIKLFYLVMTLADIIKQQQSYY